MAVASKYASSRKTYVAEPVLKKAVLWAAFFISISVTQDYETHGMVKTSAGRRGIEWCILAEKRMAGLG